MFLFAPLIVVASLRIGLICPGHPGHLNPTCTVGAELQRRGHHVTLIATPQGKGTAQRNSLKFAPIGISEYKSGILDRDLEREGKLSGFSCFRHTVQLFRREEQIILRDLPTVLKKCKIDALCVDQLSPAAMDVADVLEIPFGVLCTALPLHLDSSVPPFITTWRPPHGKRDVLRRIRNRVANLAIVAVAAPSLYRLVNRYRAKHGLRKYGYNDAQSQGLFQIAQIPEFADFPRTNLPSHFYYSQPWHDMDRKDDATLPFDWNVIDTNKPIVYASLGTVQNRIMDIYTIVAEACRNLDVQLILSLGRKGATLDDADNIPDNCIVLDFAPQLELLRKADLVITHAGMNTALEALACGIPMVAIPIGNDQPGVAARLAELGVAQVVSAKRATPKMLKRAICTVLSDVSHQEAANQMACKIHDQCPTLEHTAKLIETGFAQQHEPLVLQTRSRRRDLEHANASQQHTTTILSQPREPKRRKLSPALTSLAFSSILAFRRDSKPPLL